MSYDPTNDPDMHLKEAKEHAEMRALLDAAEAKRRELLRKRAEAFPPTESA